MTAATVRLARPSERGALIQRTKHRLGVPDAASSCWERLTRALCNLFGARGIRFVVGNVNELTQQEAAPLARPAGISWRATAATLKIALLSCAETG